MTIGGGWKEFTPLSKIEYDRWIHYFEVAVASGKYYVIFAYKEAERRLEQWRKNCGQEGYHFIQELRNGSRKNKE